MSTDTSNNIPSSYSTSNTRTPTHMDGNNYNTAYPSHDFSNEADHIDPNKVLELEHYREAVNRHSKYVRWFYTPWSQCVLLGFVCFLCPGMFNALTGMGAGGQVDPTNANNGNIALYSTFAGFSIIAGGVHNFLGPPLTLALGGIGYGLYAGSLLSTNINGTSWSPFVVAAGAVLGVCAGLLWTAQGCVMMSYPKEKDKGKFIAVFWIIFNLGAVMGGALAFGINFDNPNGSVSNSTYVAFIVLMGLGAALGLFLAKPQHVFYPDGTPVAWHRSNSVKYEIINLSHVFTDWRMLMLAPAIFSSNFFYTYQFNIANAATFDVRTRGFNNMFYWGAQMVGALVLGWLILDNTRWNRKLRAQIGVSLVFALNMAIWIGTFFQQQKFDRADPPLELDFTDSGSTWGPIFLYALYGLLDSMFQTSLYWSMGALTNDAPTLARYAAFYKSVQSAGSAVSWSVDNMQTSYMNEMIINWVLTSVSLVLVFIVASRGINETEVHIENLPVDEQLQLAHVNVETPYIGKDTDNNIAMNKNQYADEYGAIKADDNTFDSPIKQSPLASTKSINDHV